MGVLRDPALCFLVVGAVVGTALVFVAPRFDGVDESAHFARAYQISEGRLVPEEVDGAAGGGACLPVDLIVDFRLAVLDNFVGGVVGADDGEPVVVTRDGVRADVELLLPCSDPDERFEDIATYAWYSPIAYAPQALGIGAARAVGTGTNGMLLAGRLVGMAVYVGVAFVAIRRAPRGRWVLHASAIVPIALVTAAGITPDAIAAALALVVVSSALRFTTFDEITPRAVGIEALPLALLLGLGKPTYWIVGLAYLLPLLSRHRPRGAPLLVIPAAAGLIVSSLWQRATTDLFECDVRFFGFSTAPDEQLRSLFRSPHQFLGEAIQTTWNDGGRWLRELVATYDRAVGHVPLVVTLAGAVVLLLIAVQADGDAPAVRGVQRGLLVVLAILGLTAVLAGFYVYCSPPGELAAPFTGARHLLPLLPVLLVGVGPPYAHWPGLTSRIPPTIAEAPAGLALVLAVATHG